MYITHARICTVNVPAPPTMRVHIIEVNCGTMNVLVVVLALSYVAVCSADWQDGNEGVDRMNGDLPDMPIQLKTGATSKDCAQFCYSSAQCKAWVFCKPNCGGSTAPQCYLKAEVTQQSANPCRVSLSKDTPLQVTLYSMAYCNFTCTGIWLEWTSIPPSSEVPSPTTGSHQASRLAKGPTHDPSEWSLRPPSPLLG